MSKMQINQYIYINTENPFFEKLHLLKSHLLNQKTKDLVEKTNPVICYQKLVINISFHREKVVFYNFLCQRCK